MKMRALRGQSAGYAYALVDLDQLGYFETQPHGNVNTTGASIISDSTKNETISRRNVFSLLAKWLPLQSPHPRPRWQPRMLRPQLSAWSVVKDDAPDGMSAVGNDEQAATNDARNAATNIRPDYRLAFG
jgi:hypothetical protein